MGYSCKKSWDGSSDSQMTKEQWCMQSGTAVNTLEKIEKEGTEVVDIADADGERYFDYVQYGISAATVRNWERLKIQPTGRLTMRANKKKSTRRILPLEYFKNKENVFFIQNILDFIDENDLSIANVIFSLGINLLIKADLYEKKHVTDVLKEYSEIPAIHDLVSINLPDDEYDILGLVYQSYLKEGKKNITGSYYTPQKIAAHMTKGFVFSDGQVFLDPCCGSGAVLLTVSAENPKQVFGMDSDRIAVLIAKINLLLKYSTFEFVPQIYEIDFLNGVMPPVFKMGFDYVATNPPWGAKKENYGIDGEFSSKETFSLFFVRSYQLLKKNGIIRFLFPESILNVKTHKDIRKFILETRSLVSITAHETIFSGVATKYVDIECKNGVNSETFMFYFKNRARKVSIQTAYETENLTFNLLSEEDLAIIHTVKEKGCYSLRNSIWAIGIVTGDNKGKLFSEHHDGMEKIYTGKEIQPFRLRPAKNYLMYDRKKLQQVAGEEIYRAPEKLVYKFISNRPVFAYDDSASLFLNSANILIPNIPCMDIKAVLAFLNSALFQFVYMKLFGGVKILKGNLMELPFPKLSNAENNKLMNLVDDILKGDIRQQKEIEKFIFAIYGLTEDQADYVRRIIDGKAD